MEKTDYKVTLESFEGPLDLLLNLINKAEIDIYDIPIHTITSQYMEYIYASKKLNLEVASEFLVMASTLLEIKSKMLLPKEKIVLDGEEYEIDPREELVNRILEYRRFKEASERLKSFRTEKSKTYYKPKEDLSIYEDGIIDFNEFDLDSLVETFNRLLEERGIEKEEIDIEKLDRQEYTIMSCVSNILERLKHKSKIKFSDLIEKDSELNEIITYFLSLLELVKNKNIIVRQDRQFAELIIENNRAEEQE